MRKSLLLAAALLGTSAASAHDLWLQPVAFKVSSAARVPVSILVGHGKDRENWGVRSDRILLLRKFAPNGQITDLKPLIRPGTAAPVISLPFAEAGTHLLVMESSNASSDLPAARFNDFLQEEGLTAVIRHRQRTGTAQRPGRELYSRRAKSLVQVGKPDGKGPSVSTKRLGLTLEIVPERDPYTLPASERLPVRVYYEGQPLGGALVKLTNLDADAKPTATQLTDRAGRAFFAVPRAGKWLLNVVWSKPITGNPKADFQTTFSSLSFGY